MLWDTNSIIYLLENQIPRQSSERLLEELALNPPIVSVVSELELLSWRRLDAEAIAIIKDFLANSMLVNLTDEVKIKTIEIRRAISIKLPDAIIAASAYVYGVPILTHNSKDFERVPGLKVLDPFLF